MRGWHEALCEQGLTDLVPPRERPESDAEQEPGRGRDGARSPSVRDRAEESRRGVLAEDGGGGDELEVRRRGVRHARDFWRPEGKDERCCRPGQVVTVSLALLVPRTASEALRSESRGGAAAAGRRQGDRRSFELAPPRLDSPPAVKQLTRAATPDAARRGRDIGVVMERRCASLWSSDQDVGESKEHDAAKVRKRVRRETGALEVQQSVCTGGGAQSSSQKRLQRVPLRSGRGVTGNHRSSATCSAWNRIQGPHLGAYTCYAPQILRGPPSLVKNASVGWRRKTRSSVDIFS